MNIYRSESSLIWIENNNIKSACSLSKKKVGCNWYVYIKMSLIHYFPIMYCLNYLQICQSFTFQTVKYQIEFLQSFKGFLLSVDLVELHN